MVETARRRGVARSIGQLFQAPTVAAFAASDPERTLAGPTRIAQALPIRRDGSERPLFVMHMPSGEVTFAYRLERHIAPGIPVYGLPGRPREAAPVGSLAEAAADLLPMMRAVQARGPYRLLGWSFGGLLAYELATQLLAQGESVEFLGLIDTGRTLPRAPSSSLLDDLEDVDGWLPVLAKGPAELARLRSLLAAYPAGAGLAARIPTLQEHADELLNVVAAPIAQMTLGEVERWLLHWRAHERAMASYVHAGLPLRLDLFACQDTEEDPDLHLDWEELFPPQRLRVTPLRGEHGLLMNEPYVSAVGHAISAAIRSALPALAR
jgi:thioesterase domain-containing protein